MRFPFGGHSNGQKCLCDFCPLREVYLYISSPDFLVTNFLIKFLTSPDDPAKLFVTAHVLVHNCTTTHFSFQKQPGALLNVLLSGNISLHHYPSSMFQRGAVALQMFTSGWLLKLCRTICISGVNLHFLYQLFIGNCSWSHGCSLGDRRKCLTSSGHHGLLGHFFK